MPVTTTKDLHGVWGSSASDVYAVGEDGTTLHYDGGQWLGVDYGFSIYDDLWAVWGTSASDVFVAGDSGTVLHYDGARWAELNTRLGVDLRDIWGTSASNVIAAGAEDATVAHYDGLNWYAVGRTYSRMRGVWGSSPADVFAVGDNNAILHFAGQTCDFDIDPRSATFPNSGGTSTFAVDATPDHCIWQASPGTAGITVDAGCGVGDGVVTYTVSSSSYKRVGYITVMDQRFDVLQIPNACTYAIDPGDAEFTSLGGSGTFSITASFDGCAWTAESKAYWLTLDSEPSGAGDETIAYSVAANPGADDREGVLMVQGLSYVVRQSGDPTPVVTVGGSTAAEPDVSGAFTLHANPAASSDLTIQYAVGGSADAGADYAALPATTVLTAGLTSVTIPLAVIDDGEVEENETVTLELEGGSGYAVGVIASSTITIVDDDGAPGQLYLPLVLR
jgi:hypothetical protein